MSAPEPLGPRLRELFVGRLHMLFTKAPRERPDLLIVVIALALLVLAGYAVAYLVGA